VGFFFLWVFVRWEIEIKLAGFVRQGVVAKTRGSNFYFYFKINLDFVGWNLG
jgi:hypothetical protein